MTHDKPLTGIHYDFNCDFVTSSHTNHFHYLLFQLITPS